MFDVTVMKFTFTRSSFITTVCLGVPSSQITRIVHGLHVPVRGLAPRQLAGVNVHVEIVPDVIGEDELWEADLPSDCRPAHHQVALAALLHARHVALQHLEAHPEAGPCPRHLQLPSLIGQLPEDPRQSSYQRIQPVIGKIHIQFACLMETG